MSPSEDVVVRLHWLQHGAGLPLPAYHSAEAAGLDLAAAIPEGQPMTLMPGARTLVPAGFALEIPNGFEGQVRPRSGLAHKHGITVLNSPGTIDADYRGEIKVLLINLGSERYDVHRGDRIAQLVIAPVTRVRVVTAESITESARGPGGFGSTGSG
jgi:dUTP pyrophosphatase